ncbi:hypothetical protein PCASD_18873 [Puccinia coronata f. sp. avenae]|uniref:Uncharacterized protein n=1 Tax=Puccinia coronata f. sp. avenae TaxID=200324 RepID=A0A2N5UCW4_9BASI|nr:hypothetical protein PCASD_18873 [Puccinia coronata f. sp. avenae]
MSVLFICLRFTVDGAFVAQASRLLAFTFGHHRNPAPTCTSGPTPKLGCTRSILPVESQHQDGKAVHPRAAPYTRRRLPVVP